MKDGGSIVETYPYDEYVYKNVTYRAFNGFAGSSWGFMQNDSGGNCITDMSVLNMLGTGVSFGIHSAFGSRGNSFKNCKVMSCTSGQIWGFVVDKGAGGNIFEDCVASTLIGNIASAAYVLRGSNNIMRNCVSSDIRVVVSPQIEYGFFAPGHERVLAHVLRNNGGADEHEYSGTKIEGNIFDNLICSGLRSHTESDLPRPQEIISRLGGGGGDNVPVGISSEKFDMSTGEKIDWGDGQKENEELLKTWSFNVPEDENSVDNTPEDENSVDNTPDDASLVNSTPDDENSGP